MRTRGEKLLMAFLTFGVALLILGRIYRMDQADTIQNSHGSGQEQAKTQPVLDTTLTSGGIGSLHCYHLTADSAKRLILPKELQEISGLAMTTDDRLLAHDDEKGIIYEIDYRTGSLVKSFMLSDNSTPVLDDFEGIAVADGSIFLVTSSGRVYQCREGGDGEAVTYNVYTTGVGRDSEIESLAYEPKDRTLVFMTKNSLSASHKGILTLYKWSIDDKKLIEDAQIAIPVADFALSIKSKSFRPSSIERHPQSGTYFVVAAQECAIAEISPGGQVIAVAELPKDLHRQAEGITFSAQGTLFISDEGGNRRASLTLYTPSGSQ